MGSKKVLFLVPYPVKHAPSQRFRVELFEPYMQEAGIEYTMAPFMDEQTWHVLYTKGSAIQKLWGLAKGYLKRLKTVLIDIHQYDHVFVHREASPLGPPIFEWIVAKLWRKKMIFDYDDAIWMHDNSTTVANKFASVFKSYWKVKYICKWSYKVVGGNDFLCNFARPYNNNVVFIPTCVDMRLMHNSIKQHGEHKVVVGWTGSHSTMFYLDIVEDVLRDLQKEIDFSVLIISNKKPELDLRDWEFIKWNKQTEIDDLMKMDIGIMPMVDNAWAEGKCGFKLIQYMSLGIPGVASPAGVNKVIIEDNINGYVCDTQLEWKDRLKLLIKDAALRKKMGEAGHKKMDAQYSVHSQKDKFINLFS